MKAQNEQMSSCEVKTSQNQRGIDFQNAMKSKSWLRQAKEAHELADKIRVRFGALVQGRLVFRVEFSIHFKFSSLTIDI